MSLSDEEIKEAVRKRYGELALLNQQEPCCNCGAIAAHNKEIPAEALAVGDSCGDPLEHTRIQAGEVVLDLGSGGGIDVLRASKLVGGRGRVIGLDATPQMIFRSRETARKHGYQNVEFRLGEIEHMPIDSNSVDLVISNCVLNLVPDKTLAFKEVFRVLKPGGRISISDMIATQHQRGIIKPDEWAACIAGAVTFEKYKGILEKTGFENIEAKDEAYTINGDESAKGLEVKSMAWVARKPN